MLSAPAHARDAERFRRTYDVHHCADRETHRGHARRQADLGASTRERAGACSTATGGSGKYEGISSTGTFSAEFTDQTYASLKDTIELDHSEVKI
jgi:hypothetical protein